MSEEESSQKENSSNYLVFVGIGAELIGIEIAAVYVGMSIDKKMGWEGYALTGLLLIGLVGWLLHVIKMLQRFDQQEKE